MERYKICINHRYILFYANSGKCHLQDFERNIFILNKLWCGRKLVHLRASGYFRIFIWPGPGERVPAILDSLRITQTHSYPFPTPLNPYIFDTCDSIDYKPKHILYSALQKQGRSTFADTQAASHRCTNACAHPGVLWAS